MESKRWLGLATVLVWGFGTTGVAAKSSEHDFGPELPIVRSLELGGSMDAAVEGDTLYVIGRGNLHVADVSDPAAPRIVGRLTNLGNTRQIEVHRGVAYVTAREDGLFIVDVKKPDSPALLCHYDTIELATGIALSGDVAFVACRTAGVELVDVSEPRRPVHLSTVRTGEAQSVVARNGFLYAGVWGSRELVICDVRDPYRPAVISKTPLDGYGDGVAVRGKYCFVATGHHARGWRRDDGEGDASPQYGAGHGLEIFDVGEPAKPVFVSRVKTRRFYRIGMDMWDVMIAGDYAFLGDTYNGVFVVDISNIERPRLVGHRQLAPMPRTIDGLETGERLPAPVGGIALAKDTLYVAGAWTDLHVVDAAGMARAPEKEPDQGPEIPPGRPPRVDPRFRVYRPDGQVYGVAFIGDTALVAAGAAGLHAVALGPEIQRLRVFPTDGFARDVAVHVDYAYVAEATGGLSIWRRDDDALLRRVGRYRPERGGVAQVVVPPPGRYALLHVGQNELQIVDVSDPREPALMLTDKHLGLFYTFPLVRGLLDDRYAGCLWHATGYRWYDLYGGPKPVFSGDHLAMRANFADGMAVLGEKALLVSRGKYSLIGRDERRPPQELPAHGVRGCYLTGEPTIDGNTLYLSNRVRGTVQAVDVSQIESPRLLGAVELAEHPGPIVVHNGIPVIPAGYQGLLLWELVRGEP
ncbi:MAG TPA: hypothetical protein VMY37_33055 [Thermoguttaceae bacterium]|nr:hypothetical protein [Thermoguttaceae bacterium]